MDNSDLTEAAEIEEKTALKKKIEDLESDILSLTHNWKRAVADYQNLQKRMEKEKEEWSKFSNLALLGRLLDLRDDLERAQTHLKDSGLDMVSKNLQNIILDQGLKEIDVLVGGAFDPNFQECVEVVAGMEDQKVTQVVGKGYIIGDKVIRPAKVKVSKINHELE